MCDNECGQCNATISSFKAAASSNVVFVGSVESFDVLFEVAIEFRFFIEVL